MMRHMHAKRFEDWAAGDSFTDGKHHGLKDAVVACTADDPGDSNRSYLLVSDGEGRYGIYCVEKLARCYPRLTRFIPASVMREFLMRVFLDPGGAKCSQDGVVRVPVAAPALTLRGAVQEAAVPGGSGERDGSASASLPLESAMDAPAGPAPMLPEIDFP